MYPGRYYRWRLYSIDEAIEAHRNTNSSKMFDATNAPINIAVEMNMQGEKKTRFVANFHKMAMIQYPFDHGEDRKVLALAKTEVCPNRTIIIIDLSMGNAFRALVPGHSFVRSPYVAILIV